MVGNVWHGAWFNGTKEEYLEQCYNRFKQAYLMDWFILGITPPHSEEDIVEFDKFVRAEWDKIDKKKHIDDYNELKLK